MGSLIYGYFKLHHPRAFDKEHDDPPPSSSSPQKDRSYLTVFNSCAPLGTIMKADNTFEAEIRLYAGKNNFENQVLFIHGQFDITVNNDIRYLRIDSHRFMPIESEELASSEFCTNVSLLGRASPWNDNPATSSNLYFVLEVGVFVRNLSRKYTIVCRLNRSIPGNKRWLNTNVPQNGSSVMISGYLESEEICELLVEVETLHYISGLGASEATPSPQASKPGKFGTPKRRGYVSGNTSNTASTSQSAAGPSTPTPTTRAHKAKSKKLKVKDNQEIAEEVSGGITTPEEDAVDTSAVLGRRKAGTRK